MHLIFLKVHVANILSVYDLSFYYRTIYLKFYVIKFISLYVFELVYKKSFSLFIGSLLYLLSLKSLYNLCTSLYIILLLYMSLIP